MVEAPGFLWNKMGTLQRVLGRQEAFIHSFDKYFIPTMCQCLFLALEFRDKVVKNSY